MNKQQVFKKPNLIPTNPKLKTLFVDYDKAKQFALFLKFKSGVEWRKWAKTNDRPSSIPKDPSRFYEHTGWLGWGDFLGTGNIANQNRKWWPFEEVCEFARSLKLKSGTEWRKWAKTDSRPVEIPANPPRTYANKGWRGWGHFLGTGNVGPQDMQWQPFEEARKFARSLNFKSKVEWRKWARTDNRLVDIPSWPNEVYEMNGWAGWGDFLGTGNVGPQDWQWRSFEEACKLARSLKFKNGAEWEIWAKTKEKPTDIPASPGQVYANKGWNGWGHFLGTGFVATRDRQWRSFEAIRDFARSLGFKSVDEWKRWAKTDSRPIDIPADPQQTLAEDWAGWSDFLGNKNIRQEWCSFEEAREFSRSLKLKSVGEWKIWIKTDVRPEGIPACPNEIYKNKGWVSWGDWLGNINASIEKIRSFVHGMRPYLNGFDPGQLFAIFQQQADRLDINGKEKLLMHAILARKFSNEDLGKFINGQSSQVDDYFIDIQPSEENEELKVISDETMYIDSTDFPYVKTIDVLEALDSSLVANSDAEVINFLVESSVANIWKHAFNDEDQALEQLAYYNGEGVYALEVSKRFKESYDGSKNLVIPGGCSFPYPIKLMQRFTAYSVQQKKRIGNWCGTGAGKTFSAILASRCIDARITIICCPNSVIEGWEKAILEAYPDSIVLVKSLSDKLVHIEPNQFYYLIFNYEFFQQPQTKERLEIFLCGVKIDFVVIDEIHYSKQRTKKVSERKSTITFMLAKASLINDNLCVLGMSATPVINNLFEGRTLLELITGVCYDDLETKATASNCNSLYQKLITNGIRWLPDYGEKPPLLHYVDCAYLLPSKVRLCGMGNVEAFFLQAKIPLILDQLKSKTIVYIHYLEGILIPLQEAIVQRGWNVAVFTGEDKTGLKKFLAGEADILIGSSCIGTGVDGLQHISNRLVIGSLPWTHAEYKQLIGRLYRQGQKSDQVEVIVPLAYAMVDGERKSWCESRWDRIQFKKSIADAAVDGIVPEGQLRSHAQALNDHRAWLEKLECEGENVVIERQKIGVELLNEFKQVGIRRVGDLTIMNQKINREASVQTHQRFFSNPSEWHDYHAIYRENRKDWEVIPYEEAIKWCQERSHYIVGDFGCGEAFLAKELTNKVHSFDHVAINEDVIACDMSNVPLGDACLNVAIFSLSLMGTNFVDYLKEARRCLMLDGHLWIAEPTSRIKDEILFKELLERIGFYVLCVKKRGKFTFIEALKSGREINEEMVKFLMEQQLLL